MVAYVAPFSWASAGRVAPVPASSAFTRPPCVTTRSRCTPFPVAAIGAGGIGWAGSADGGSRLLHTRDGRVSWEAREAPFGVLPLAALQVVHTRDGSPPVLMAATYDPRLQVTQLWRTLDQGASWERGRQVPTAWPVEATGESPPLLTLGNLLFVERPDGSWAQMTIRGISGVRRVAGAGDTLFTLTTAGILRSRDRGLTWVRDDAGLPGDQVMDIAVADGDIYALLAGGTSGRDR